MNHLELVRKRQAEPDFFTEAQRRQNAVFKKLRKTTINRMAVALQDEPTTKGKFIWLKKIMTTLGQATEGIVPCKAGCSDCCKMATNITSLEAEEISKATGIPVTVPSSTLTNEESIKAFQGIPCPFLRESQCSIYHVRPFACRAHYSMDKDNLLCKIVPGETIRSPTVNTSQFSLLHALAHVAENEMHLADIREFFPPKD